MNVPSPVQSFAFWRSRLKRYQDGIWLSIAMAIAITLRHHNLDREWFSWNEAFSANFAQQSWFDVIVASTFLDVHPPFYYLQLHFWALMGNADVWLLENSVLWSSLQVVSLWYVARRLGFHREAPITGLLLSVSGFEVLYAHQLRMYAMISCLSIWLWYFAHLQISEHWNRQRSIILIIIATMIVYSHASAFLVVFYTGVYSLIVSIETRGIENIKHWAWPYVVAAVVAAPVIANALLRGVTHTIIPTFADLVETIGTIVLGQDRPPMVNLVATGFFGLSVALNLLDTKFRPTAISFLVLPLIFCWVVSYAVKPIWISYVFLFMCPIVCLSVARNIVILADHRWVRSVPAPRWIAVTVAVTAMMAVSGTFAATQTEQVYKGENFREAASTIRRLMAPGDVLYVPEAATFWGIAWYVIGPRWGSVLDVQNPLLPDLKPRTARFYELLGPTWLRRLHLIPRTREVEFSGVRFIVGRSPPSIQDAQHIWLVTYGASGIGSEALQATGFTIARQYDYEGVLVYSWLRN